MWPDPFDCAFICQSNKICLNSKKNVITYALQLGYKDKCICTCGHCSAFFGENHYVKHKSLCALGTKTFSYTFFYYSDS